MKRVSSSADLIAADSRTEVALIPLSIEGLVAAGHEEVVRLAGVLERLVSRGEGSFDGTERLNDLAFSWAIALRGFRDFGNSEHVERISGERYLTLSTLDGDAKACAIIEHNANDGLTIRCHKVGSLLVLVCPLRHEACNLLVVEHDLPAIVSSGLTEHSQLERKWAGQA